jgi:DNA-binding NarL/FixJ family response regulator
MQHIAIVDDQLGGIQKVIDCLYRAVDFAIDITACNGHDLIRQLSFMQAIPDIFITDIHMPVMDGIAVNFYLSHHYPSSKIISLSAYFDDETICQAFESGAHGYLVKPQAESIILSALEAVKVGQLYLDERAKMTENVMLRILSAQNRKYNQADFNLTPREKTFIMLSATTLTYDQIARLMFIELKTVQTYFDRIAKKLNVSSRQALTLFSLQNGLARIANYMHPVTVN